MGPTKPGHDESTSLMTISSPRVPGGDPSTGVRKRQTSDHRTRPPTRRRRNGGIAVPEGLVVSPFTSVYVWNLGRLAYIILGTGSTSFCSVTQKYHVYTLFT